MPVSKPRSSTPRLNESEISSNMDKIPFTLPPRPPMLGHHHHDFGGKIIMTLFGVLLVYGIVFTGTLIRNNLRQYDFIGKADKYERSIRVEGMGKVVAKPDIAMTTIGMIAEEATVAEAQTKNTEVMNRLIMRLKDMGIKEEDIQTANYNISPRYRYTEREGQILNGYTVSQNITVKIRDMSKSNEVLGLAGEAGVNSVSGLEFTIDDRDVYLKAAREKALEKVAQKANYLSRMLGVNMVGVISYDEYEPATGGPVPLFARSFDAGMGGAEAMPQIESGSLEVILNVGVTFEVRN